jgi:sugar phosphate isomerase/epimerase
MSKIGIRVHGAQLDNTPSTFVSNLNIIKEIGFQAVEICPEDFDAIRCGEVERDIAINLKSILAYYDLEVSVHVPLPLNLFNREDPSLHKRVFESCLEFTSMIGAKLLVYHPGRFVDNIEFYRYGKPELKKKEKRKLLEYEVRVISDVASRYKDVIIAMENQRPYIEYSPYCYAERLDELADQVGSIGMNNVGLMIDTGHLMLASRYLGYDYIDVIRQKKIKPVHFHINDNHGITTYFTEKDKKSQHPFGRGDEHIVPGTGIFPFAGFFDEFSEYEGNHIIELTGRFFYPSAIKRSYDFVRTTIYKDN